MIKTFYKTEDGKEYDNLQEAQGHEYMQIRQKDNQVQELMFKLMKLASFNGFDGEFVVKKLKERKDLWKGAVMDSDGDYYLLRDISSGEWHTDTLKLEPEEGKKDELFKWAKRVLHPDEINWKDTQKDYRGVSLEPETLILWWD